MSYGCRLKEVRLHLGLSQQEFAGSIGVKNKQTISDIENDRQKELQKKSELLLKEKYFINLHWLNTGEGDMLLSSSEDVNEDRLIYNNISADIEVIVDELKKMNVNQRRSILRHVLEISDT